MKLILQDQSKKQQAEINVDKFTGNLIQGRMQSCAFDQELMQKITAFEELMNGFHLGKLLDESAEQLDAYGWTIVHEDWTIFDFQIFNKKDISFRIKCEQCNYLATEVKHCLEKLGYDNRWIIYEYLTIDELKAQYQQYQKAIEDPTSKEAENGHRHPEHLRHCSFWNISESRASFTNQALEQLIELVKCDSDAVMAGNFYRYLISQKKVNKEQINHFIELKTLVLNNRTK